MEIKKFNPTEAELIKAVEAVKDLKIKGVDDVSGYAVVNDARKKLGKYRIAITKFGKAEREEALAYQRMVLKKEKELLAIVVPKEDEFKQMLNEIDIAKEKEERKVMLPSRKKMLEEINEKMTDDDILNMDDKEFSQFYTDKKTELVEKEAEEKERAKELKRARLDAAKKAREAERARVEKAKIAKEEIEESKAKELARNTIYNKWLKDNNFNEEDFVVEGESFPDLDGTVFTLYKKVSSITIK